LLRLVVEKRNGTQELSGRSIDFSFPFEHNWHWFKALRLLNSRFKMLGPKRLSGSLFATPALSMRRTKQL
jgi:hypothetical protein